MEEKNYEKLSKNLSSLVIIFGIVIILLLAYIFIAPKINIKGFNKFVTSKNGKTVEYIKDYDEDDDELHDVDDSSYSGILENVTSKKISNPLVEVVSMNYVDHSNTSFLGEIKNISDIDIYEATPFLILYDSDGNPIYAVSGYTTSNFKKGTSKFVEFYDENLSKVKYSSYNVVLGDYYIPDEDELKFYSLADKMKFDQSVKTDEYGDKVIKISGKNPSSEDILVDFVVVYYNEDGVIYLDYEYLEVDGNSNFEDEIYYLTEYDDSIDFPQGYKYKVVLDSVEERIYLDDEDLYDDYEEDEDIDLDW